MAWVTDNLVAPGVSGTTVANTDVISKEFHVEDPRFLQVTVTGGLTTYKIQTKTGSSAWRDVKTASAAFLDFVGPAEIGTTYPGDGYVLLGDRCRIVATGAGDVTEVYIGRIL